MERGFDFYLQSGRADLQPPAMASVIQFYRSRAPKQLDLSVALASGPVEPAGFRREEIVAKEATPYTPAISAVQWFPDAAQAGGGRMFASDMRNGAVFEIHPSSLTAARICTLRNPARLARWPVPGPTVAAAAPGPWTLLAADLGSYDPADHDQGQIVVLAEQDQGPWKTDVLLQGVGAPRMCGSRI